MKAVVFVAALASAGCLRTTSYKCDSNDKCGPGAVCEGTGFCSFADPNCADGRRYGEYSGIYSNKCVGEVVANDGGVDSPGDGPMGDVPLGNCPVSYNITHGAHRYKVIANMAAHATQKAACAVDGNNAYLAVPNDMTELSALIADSTAQLTWVGVDDVTTNNTYVTANGGSFSASDPLWDTGEPDNMPLTGGGQADCAAARMSSSQLIDDRCSEAYPAVCECEP